MLIDFTEDELDDIVSILSFYDSVFGKKEGYLDIKNILNKILELSIKDYEENIKDEGLKKDG